jgi:hypothetical protein
MLVSTGKHIEMLFGKSLRRRMAVFDGSFAESEGLEVPLESGETNIRSVAGFVQKLCMHLFEATIKELFLCLVRGEKLIHLLVFL